MSRCRAPGHPADQAGVRSDHLDLHEAFSCVRQKNLRQIGGVARLADDEG
jgi:hypothetical protein